MGEKLTANKVAKKIRDIIDGFWKGELSREEATNKITDIMSDSELRIKVKRGDAYTGVFLNIIGKKRLKEFELLYTE